MGNLLVKYRNVGKGAEPSISDPKDKNAAVQLKEGRKAHKLAEEIAGSLERIGEEYGVDKGVMFSPYTMEFSMNPLPKYKGLDEKGIDVIRVPKYMATPRVARHEGSHMGHRRVLEQKFIQEGESESKLRSEEALGRSWKRHPFICESFANKYSDLRAPSVGASATMLGIEAYGLGTVSERLADYAAYSVDNLQALGTGAAALAVMGIGACLSGKYAIDHFRSFEKVL